MIIELSAVNNDDVSVHNNTTTTDAVYKYAGTFKHTEFGKSKSTPMKLAVM